MVVASNAATMKISLVEEKVSTDVLIELIENNVDTHSHQTFDSVSHIRDTILIATNIKSMTSSAAVKPLMTLPRYTFPFAGGGRSHGGSASILFSTFACSQSEAINDSVVKAKRRFGVY